YAGGLEWVCWADLAIADRHATFGVTCRRWNIGLADGGTQRLPRIVGYRRALELIITGRVIDAEEALRIGLVNEVVPGGTCLSRAIELAEAIAALPQGALRSDKEAVVRGFGRPLEEGLRIEAECFNRERGGPAKRPGSSSPTPSTSSSCSQWTRPWCEPVPPTSSSGCSSARARFWCSTSPTTWRNESSCCRRSTATGCGVIAT